MNRVRRRTFLGLTAVAALPLTVACSSDPDTDPTQTPGPTPTDSTSPTTDEDPLRTQVAQEEVSLIARYEATIAAHPDLSVSLAPLAEQHRAHLSAVLGESAASPSPPSLPTAPNDPAAALAEIIAAERSAADARTSACAMATSIELARLLALIAASEASHAEALSTPASSGEGVAS